MLLRQRIEMLNRSGLSVVLDADPRRLGDLRRELRRRLEDGRLIAPRSADFHFDTGIERHLKRADMPLEDRRDAERLAEIDVPGLLGERVLERDARVKRKATPLGEAELWSEMKSGQRRMVVVGRRRSFEKDACLERIAPAVRQLER